MADRTVKVRLDASVGGFTAAMKTASLAVKDLNQKWIDLDRKGKLHELESAATGTAAALGLVIGAAILTAAKFEAAMSRVKAATGATGEELDRLRSAALEAGRQGTYSALEAADAITELGKAGLSTSQILSGGLQAALNLAAAGELQVGKAAELAASAMTQFKLKGEDLPHVADLLAAAAGKAQGSVEDAGMALNQAGLVAAQAGLSIEETTAAIAAMASAGLIGSDAGTSFKTMLQRLIAPTQESAQIMADLGIAAYDASGQFVGLSEFASQLQGALGRLTDEQRNQALATIFGSDAIRAAAVMFEQGSSGIDAWTAKVNDQGYAQDQAAQKTDNLIGDLKRLRGVITGTLIEEGGNATGGLRAMTQVVTALANSFAALPAPISSTITFLTVMAALLTGGTMLWLKMAPAIAAMKPAMDAVSASIMPIIARSEVATIAVTRLGLAMRVLGTAAGILGIVGLAAGVIISLATSSKEAEVQVEGLAASLDNLGRTGRMSGEASKVYGQNLEHLRGNVRNLLGEIREFQKHGYIDTSFQLDFVNADDTMDMGKATKALNGLKDAFAGIDAELAGMVQSGNLTGAQAAFGQFRNMLLGMGYPMENLNVLFPEFNAAMLDAAGTVPELVNGLGAFKEQNDMVNLSLAETLATGRSVIDVYNELNGASVSLARAQMTTIEKTQALKTTLDENGKTLNVNTEAGRENLKAILDLAEALARQGDAMIKNGASSEAVSLFWTKQREMVRALLDDLGMEEAQINELLDLYFKMPDDLSVDVKSNTGLETAKARQLRAALDGIPDYTYSKVVVETVYRSQDEFHRRHGRADGGVVPGYGGPRQDNVAMALSPGEYVVNSAAYNANRELVELINKSHGKNVFADLNVQRTRYSDPRPMAPTNETTPKVDPQAIGRAVRDALRGVTVTLDGRVVGVVQGRQADLYTRAGG